MSDSSAAAESVSARASAPTGGRRIGMRAFLLALLLGSLVPLTLFAGTVAWEAAGAERRTVRASILATTRALAAAVDEHVRLRRGALETLAQSPALQRGDLVAFHAEMADTGRLLQSGIVTLVNSDATRALFSSLPAGAPVPGQSEPELIRRVFETGQPQVSDVFVSGVTRQAIAVVAVPVRIGGVVRYSLNISLDSADFVRLLRAQNPPEGWALGIVDRRGRFLARYPDGESRAGTLASEGWRTAIRESPREDWRRMTTLDGVAVWNGQSQAPESGFIVGIGVPEAQIQAPLQRSLASLAVGGGAVLALSLAAVVLISQRLGARLGRVALAARQVPTGGFAAPPPSRVAEIDAITEALAESAVVVRDRTAERDAAERGLRELNAELERKVLARTEDLARSNEALRGQVAQRERAEAALLHAQRLETVGQLTGGVAHDFNNLLQVISGNLTLLGERVAAADCQRLIGHATSAVERGTTLTQRLLAFARKQDLESRPIEINHLVEELGQLVPQLLVEGVRYRAALGDGVWPAQADPAQLELALLNLVTNARDALVEGGTITIETANRTVGPGDAGELTPGDYVAITVADTGAGMPAEITARAFDPFFTTKPVGKGSGLGLSMVYGFARQSGGGARIDSTPGAGTRVTLLLPRSAEPAVRAEAPRPSGLAAHGEGRVLVIDDDPLVRQVTAGFLTHAGYVVTSCDGPEAALQRLDVDAPFDLVVTDFAMPGMGGGAFLEALGRRWPALPVIVVTGYTAEPLRLAPGIALLRKPFGFDQLVEAARTALSGKASPDNRTI